MSVQIANVRMVVSTSPSHELLARLAAPISMECAELVLSQLLPQQPIIDCILKGWYYGGDSLQWRLLLFSFEQTELIY